MSLIYLKWKTINVTFWKLNFFSVNAMFTYKLDSPDIYIQANASLQLKFKLKRITFHNNIKKWHIDNSILQKCCKSKSVQESFHPSIQVKKINK